MRRLVEALGIALGLGALAVMAHARALPGIFGLRRDDGEYIAFALALLDGLGYVNPSEPGLPVAARYPPGFPLVLAIAMARAEPGADQLARLAWVAPAGLAVGAGLAYVALRRLGGFGPLAAFVAAAAIFAAPEALQFGQELHADPPFVALSLITIMAAETAWRRGLGARWWAGVGALAGAALLLRYAGLALVLALALGLARGRRWTWAGGAAAGLALLVGPWIAFRALAGGENYVGTIADVMPAEWLGWPARALLACAHVALRGVPGALFAPFVDAPAGPMWVAGAAIAGVVAWGLWGWLREPDAPGLAPLFALTTIGLVVGVHAGYVVLLPTLPTRLLLPVAPLLWIAAAKGAADLLKREPGLAPLRAWLGRGALAAAVAALGVAHFLRPPAPAGALAAQAGRHQALFAAVRREVPADARLLTQLPAMVWLYTGRPGFALPYVHAHGQLAALDPVSFLMVLEHWRITHVVLQPDVALELTASVPAFMAAFPGVLEPRGAGVLAIAPGPYEAACKAHDIRARNAAFERGR